jgi:hypothetical protein
MKMKNLTKLLAITIIMLGFSVSTFAQSSAASSTTATLIAPLTITKDLDLNFGSLASSATVGSATINAQDGILTPTGGVTDPGTIAHQVATFTITGEGSDVITVANDVTTVTLSNASGDDLTVGTFLYSMDLGVETTFNGTATIDGSGSSTFTVGATLTVPANTPAGTYASGTAGGTGDFTITINYQ